MVTGLVHHKDIIRKSSGHEQKLPSTFMSIFNLVLGNTHPSSDEEDDVVGHHDLVVVLHAGQSGTDLGLREAALPLFVDVFHELRHFHRLRVSRLENAEQRRLELLQPGRRDREKP